MADHNIIIHFQMCLCIITLVKKYLLGIFCVNHFSCYKEALNDVEKPVAIRDFT